MNRSRPRYVSGLTVVGLAYGIILTISVVLVKAYPHSELRYLFALLPLIPAGCVPVVVVRLLRRIDELQRRIQLEALGFAFGGTAVLTFGYGLLQSVGFPALNWLFVWPLMGVLWGIGTVWAVRRYL